MKAPGAVIALAVASDLNDELTVILSALRLMLAQDEIERAVLLDAQSAAQRASWKVGGLMDWANKNGAKASAVSLEGVLGLA